jgi:hypothetical protein
MRLFAPSGLAFAALLAAPVALAWTVDWPVRVRVNGHEFDQVRVESDGCALKVRLFFSAPEKGYDSRAKVRNHHRFKGRISFKNGKSVVTKIFNNRAAGRRTYTEVIDTTDQACWAKEKTDLDNVDVVGCRGRGCAVPGFEH